MFALHTLLPISLAMKPAALIEGSPEFEDSCLEADSDCAERFTQFLSHSMLEQGFTLQPLTALSSPLLHDQRGWQLGLVLDTFPLSPPRSNLAGKEENTDFSPVLPRLAAGRTRGIGERDSWGWGVQVLPPVPVQGASALLLDGELSWARQRGALRWGLEFDGGWKRARAPVAASEEQFEAREAGGYEGNLQESTYEARCGEAGCLDEFTVSQVSLRAGVSRALGAWTPHLRLGVSALREDLFIAYDETTWRSEGLQASLHTGAHYRIQDLWQLGLVSSLAPRPVALSEDGEAGAFFKLQLSLGWTAS